MISQGDLAGGRAKLEEALDADERAASEAQRLEAERRKTGAKKALNLAVLVSGTDVVKAISYYERATRLDPSDLLTWWWYAQAVHRAGRTAEAKRAFEQVARISEERPYAKLWAMTGLGDIAEVQGDLPGARRLYEMALLTAHHIRRALPATMQAISAASRRCRAHSSAQRISPQRFSALTHSCRRSHGPIAVQQVGVVKA